MAISLASLFALLPNLTPLQQSAYASPKSSDLEQDVKQNMNKDNLCNRSDGCRQANEGQQLTGNDNTATSFIDQSTTNTSSLSSDTAASTSGIPGSAGADGERGLAGPQGIQGPAGPPRTLQVIEREGAPVTSNGQIITATASCNPGEKATGGGYTWEFKFDVDDFIIFDDSATPGNAGWEVTGKYNGTSIGNRLTVFAECSSLVP